MARRQRQRTERTRRALLSAARELFRERGYQGTTVAEITERAGRAHGTFYLYFQNKHDVFSVLLSEMEETISARARELWVGRPVVEAIWLGVRDFFLVCEQNADLWQLLDGMAAVDDAAVELRTALRDTFAESIRRGMERTQTPATAHLDLDLLAQLVTAVVFRFARLGVFPGGADRLALHVAVVWSRGLGYPEAEIAALRHRVLGSLQSSS